MENNQEIKEIIEYAKKMELDGKSLYEEELEKTKDEGIKNILKMLIQAEKNHYEIFCNLEKNIITEIIKTDFSKIKTLFQEIKESDTNITDAKNHLEFYEKVLQLEIASENYYRQKAEIQKDEDAKKLLIDIAKEEKNHVILMEEFVKMCSNPQSWVEDAEFNYLEDNY